MSVPTAGASVNGVSARPTVHLSALPKSPVEQTHAIHANLDANKDFVKPNGFALGGSVDPATLPVGSDLRREYEHLLREGYVVLENVLSPEEIQTLSEALEPHLLADQRGRNRFEGRKTNRVYDLVSCTKHSRLLKMDGEAMAGAHSVCCLLLLLSHQISKSPTFHHLPQHPRILRLLDLVLLPNYLLTAYQAIQILPGELRQPLHYDDAFLNIPRPRQAFSVGTVWALTPFTADNGSTVLIPRSHLWGDELPPTDCKPVPCVMPAGSVVIFLSTLWHGGGANSTANCKRLAMSTQYCQPFIRPQENFQLETPFHVAKKLSPRLQSLIGYSIHPPFIGHANGQHPLKHLDKLEAEAKAKL
jgi:ectoine hydroxylase-related dioxygenase (phytanoyl-CoA dioxygenase family)